MEQINQHLSGEAAVIKLQSEPQTPSNDSEDNRFFRQLGQLFRQFPAKSIMSAITVISLIASTSWKTAIKLNSGSNPEIEAAQVAVLTAFPAHKLETPKETNIAVLINTLSNNL